MHQADNILLESDMPADDIALIASLGSKISEYDLIRYLPSLIRIARSNPNANASIPMLQHTLRHFCIATLRSARHIAFEDQDTPIPYLANVLYRILENPGCLGTRTTCHWEELIELVKPLAVYPIHVLQAKDVYAEILASTTDLVSALRLKMMQKEPMVTHPVAVDAWDISPPWRDEYLNAAPYKREGTEEDVGRAIYHQVQEKRRIARQYLQDEAHRQDLQDQARSHQTHLERMLAQKWAEIERWAHQLPPDSEQEQAYLNDLSSSVRHLATQQDLFKAYLHEDRTEYYAITALRQPEEVDRLHDAIHEYMTLSVQSQKMQRLQKALQEEKNEEEIAEILMHASPERAHTNPCLMLFQYLDNKMLWPSQADALQRLLTRDPQHANRFREIVEKMIMGKGKSKVVTPILAQEKAMGSNLVIVEVPRALLHTQHADMNQLSLNLFNQTAHCFEFNRSSDCSSKRLQEIHDFFVRISTKKDYLVTTGESMQALHLKYRELLLTKPTRAEDLPEWRQQVIWAEKIVHLLKTTGDALIDEVHAGLWHKKKMNYTFGEPVCVDENMVHYSTKLYEFLERYPDCQHNGETLVNRLLNIADKKI